VTLFLFTSLMDVYFIFFSTKHVTNKEGEIVSCPTVFHSLSRYVFFMKGVQFTSARKVCNLLLHERCIICFCDIFSRYIGHIYDGDACKPRDVAQWRKNNPSR